jgi:sec-independent protein translocase protein TatC
LPEDEARSPADMEIEGEPDATLAGESQETVGREPAPVTGATPQGDAQGATTSEDEGEAEAQPADDSQSPSNPQPTAAAARASTAGKANAGAPPLEPGVMPLMEHLKELRGRLIWSVGALLVTTALSFIFAKQVLVFLIAPMGDSIPQALKPTESLGNYMKVALICGVTLAMPMLVYQIGRFLAPGLTKQEKRWLFVLVPGATLCFVIGVAFAYFVMLPTAIPFLQGFMSDIIEQSWAIGEYLSFVTSLLFWIGLAFELPLFVFFLAKLGLVNADMLKKNRKYAYLGIAVIAAIITPTVDPVNMLLVMAPLVLLYELGVILAKLA